MDDSSTEKSRSPPRPPDSSEKLMPRTHHSYRCLLCPQLTAYKLVTCPPLKKKQLQLRVVMEVNWTYCGDLFIIHTYVKSLHCNLKRKQCYISLVSV